MEFIEYTGYTPPRPEPVGTARVIEKGFDTDAMQRYVVLLVDTPIEFFHGEHRVTYGMGEYIGGVAVPVPMSDEDERREIEHIASYFRATLVG